MSIAHLETPHDGAQLTTLTGRLLGLMMQRRVTKARLAAEIDVSASGVTRRLQGKTEWNLVEIVRAARLLSTSVGYLLGETDESGSVEMQKTPTVVGVGDGADSRTSD